MRRFYSTALESVEVTKDKAIETELEYIVWAKLTDFKDLHKASRAVKQEQVSMLLPKTDKNLVGGVLRVRKTVEANGEVDYKLTIKQKHSGGDGQPLNTEANVKVDENVYLQVAGIAESLVVKHRYYYPIEGTDLEWEVDAAPDNEGGYHEWVRLEVEVPNKDYKLPELPFPTEEVILPLVIQEASGVEVDREAYFTRTDAMFKQLFEYEGPLVRYIDTKE